MRRFRLPTLALLWIVPRGLSARSVGGESLARPEALPNVGGGSSEAR